jgi:hypothetical protein
MAPSRQDPGTTVFGDPRASGMIRPNLMVSDLRDLKSNLTIVFRG